MKIRTIRRGGYARIEFSWILEDNIAVQRIVEMVGGGCTKDTGFMTKR